MAEGYYTGIKEGKELYDMETLNAHLKEGWVWLKTVEKHVDSDTEKGILHRTTIVYIVGLKQDVTPKVSDEKKPSADVKPKIPPTQEAVKSVLQPQYEANEVTFEDGGIVVKVVWSQDKDWKGANKKMETLGFKYHKGPARWVYEGE